MQGLSEKEAAARLKEFGPNALRLNENRRLLRILLDVVREPMFILLAAACGLYFLLGQPAEGFMMMAALCGVAAISLYQEVRSANALAALQALTEPKAIVIRDGAKKQVAIEDVVPGDCLLLEEGEKVPADATVTQCNDLSVNEGILTGEAFPVEKDVSQNNRVYQGTVINSGRCRATVTSTGAHTQLGKIGKSIVTYTETKTALQLQVAAFVRRLALFGFVAFLLIFFVNYLHTNNAVLSLLLGLTLAMSAVPEELPVAFSSFMALGAHAIAKMGLITRQPQTVEALGAVNVICLDKTGTITVNKMTVDSLYNFEKDTIRKAVEGDAITADVLHYAFLASEQSPFDAMEKAIAEAYVRIHSKAELSPIVKEYPVQGCPPMMTHVYQKDGAYLAAAKGAVERILAVCKLPSQKEQIVLHHAKSMAAKGHRVLGVAKAAHSTKTFPQQQDDFAWQFVGLLSLYDPPKPFVKPVLQKFYEAGIAVKLLTGDYTETALSIAEEIGLQKGEGVVTGDEVMNATEEELKDRISQSNVFTRMHPEAKLKVINALKAKSFVVAMTGDGVNDGPALKAANVGIALGKGGTEVARQSADVILTDDDLRKVAEAVRQGRRIFSNLKKAIRYIVSIHIPIILIASLPVLLGWKYPNIFTPIHVIFLELIMGPTCSVFFEREPAEEGLMQQPPRKAKAPLFEREEIFISIVQGLLIAGGVLLLYATFSAEGYSLPVVRTVVFTTLILSNVFLTFADRSFRHTLATTIRYKNNLVLPVLVVSTGFLLLLHFVPFVQRLFGLMPITFFQFIVCLFTAVLCVGWFEAYKTNLKALFPPRLTDHKQAFR